MSACIASAQREYGGSMAVLYDDTEGIAFGPTFETIEQAFDFLRWLNMLPTLRWVALIGDHNARLDLLDLGGAQWKALHDEWFAERVDGETGDVLPVRDPDQTTKGGTQ